MGSLKQGEHQHPDGSFHSWSGVQFKGRRPAQNVFEEGDPETGKVAPSIESRDLWIGRRDKDPRGQEAQYKYDIGYGTKATSDYGFDRSGLPTGKRAKEIQGMGDYGASGQAEVANAGAIASMGANGTGQAMYDEGMFDQPAEAYGTVHPNQPDMVPAMQQTPIEIQDQLYRKGIDEGEPQTFAQPYTTEGDQPTQVQPTTRGYYDSTRGGKFTPGVAIDPDKAAAFAARESSGETSMSPGTIAKTFKGGTQAEAQAIESEILQEDPSAQGEGFTRARGGGHYDTLTGEWVPTTRSTDTAGAGGDEELFQQSALANMVPSTAAQTSENRQSNFRRDLKESAGMKYHEGVMAAQSEQEATGPVTTAAPSVLSQGGGWYGDVDESRKAKVKELLGTDADLQGVQGQDTQGETGGFDTDEGLSQSLDEKAAAKRQAKLDARDKEQYLEETDPEGYYDADGYWRDDKASKYMDYDADFWSLNPTFRAQVINEEQWGEISKKLDSFSRDSQLFDDIKTDREKWIGNPADYKIQDKHKKAMVKNIHDFMRGTSEYGMKGYGSSKYFGDDVNAEAEMLWQALKGSGVSIEDFNTMYNDATKFHGISDDRKKRIQEFTYVEGQHMAHSKLGNIFGAEGEKEETPKLSEGMFDESGKRMEDQLTEGFTDDSEMGGYGEKKQGQDVQLDDGSTAKVNPTSGGDIGTTVDATSPEQAVAMSGTYNTNIRTAMSGDLGTDAGRAALLSSIGSPIPIPHGYTWNQALGELTWDTMAGFSADMAGGATTTGEPVNPYDDSKTIEEKTAGVPAGTVRMDKQNEAQLSQALRMRDMAAGFYEDATGESIQLQAELAEQSAMGISREGMASLDNVSTMTTMFTTKMSTALKNNNLDAIDAQLATPMPAPPPGMVWDKSSGRFMQRPGQAGRQMNVETQKWMAMAEAAYSMRDRASHISDMGRKLDMEADRRTAEKADLDEKFRAHMLTAEIDSAEEVLMKQKIAETAELESKGKRENLQMMMQLIQNPIALGMAKRHGLLGQMETQLGFTGISDTVADVPVGAGTPNVNEWNTMTSVEKAMRIADLSEQGGDPDEFYRMIQGSAPGQMQRVQYGVLGQGGI